MTIKGVEITARAIMTEAWAIARKGQAKFGGKVSSYIREALRIAWSEAKRGNRSIVERIDELTAMGFKRWQKNGMDRMYINASTLGLRCEYYKTGNVRNATFGEYSISNCEARRIQGAKTYIDLIRRELVSDNEYTMDAAARLIGVERTGYDRRIALA